MNLGNYTYVIIIYFKILLNIKMKKIISENYKLFITEEIYPNIKCNLLLDTLNKKKVKKISFSLKQSEKVNLYSNSKNLEIKKEQGINAFKYRNICSIINLGKNYEVSFRNNRTNISNNYWIDIGRTYENQILKYKIYEGDYIKIGTLIFHILEKKTMKLIKKNFSQITNDNKKSNNLNPINKISFLTKNSNNNIINDSEYNMNNSSLNEKLSLNSSSFLKLNQINNKKKLPLNTYIEFQYICRLCLGTSYEKENPFISPCLCQKAMKYVHLNCLQKFIQSKLINIININDLIRIYYFSSFSCELCGFLFPYSIYLKDKKINYKIFDFNLPLNNYIFMENSPANKNYEIAFYILNFNKSENISIGSENVDLILKDHLISSYHCHIFLYEEEFYINNKSYDSGTLVNIGRNNKIILSYSQPLYIIYKNYIYSFILKSKFLYTLFTCLTCQKQIPIKKLDYNSIFKIYGKTNDESNNNKDFPFINKNNNYIHIINFKGKDTKLNATVNQHLIKHLGIS